MELEFDICQIKLWNQFFFSVESLKIYRLTIPQRIKIIKTYYKIGDSDTGTYRALRGNYGFYDQRTIQAIGKIVKKS